MKIEVLLFCILYIDLLPITCSHTYKVGLLLDSDNAEESNAIKRFADFISTNLDSSTTSLELEEYRHDTSFLSLQNSFCSLLSQNVAAIVTATDSTNTEILVNMANEFQVPVISTTTTDPFIDFSFLPNIYQNFAISLSPSDVYQSRAVFDLLKEYGWYQFSILASADDYGINGIVHLQYLASQDDDFSVKDVQHFNTKMKLNDSDTTPMFEKELQLIKDSLAKVIVLNCGGKFARKIFQ